MSDLLEGFSLAERTRGYWSASRALRDPRATMEVRQRAVCALLLVARSDSTPHLSRLAAAATADRTWENPEGRSRALLSGHSPAAPVLLLPARVN
jgi:hypothetical protein